MTILTKKELEKLISNKDSPLVSNMADLAVQIQGAGIDLTVASIEYYSSRGTIDLYNIKREISTTIEAPITVENSLRGYNLDHHAYKVRLNEFLNIPNDVIGFAYTRSSLLRCGAYTESAVFDPGYRGNIEVLLHVASANGIRLLLNARIIQLVFHKLDDETDAYNGIYKTLPDFNGLTRIGPRGIMAIGQNI